MAKLIYQGEMQKITDRSEEVIDAGNMHEVMLYVYRQYGAPAKKAVQRCLVSLDGVRLDKINSRRVIVSTNSEIYFFPLCSGG